MASLHGIQIDVDKSSFVWSCRNFFQIRLSQFILKVKTYLVVGSIFPSISLASRCFGPKCGGCGEKIHYQDFVRKARDKVYHLRCFTCSICAKQLSTGEVLYLQPGDEGFVCRDHYLKQGKANIQALFFIHHRNRNQD